MLLITTGIIVLVAPSCSSKNNEDAIMLSKNSVEVLAGARDTINILSNGTGYTVTTKQRNK
ncbi:MAG: hypothetical protein LKI53_09270 [Bacteroidales bacterium]|nr:hypothetical protein [Bacteroidales bacterium]